MTFETDADGSVAQDDRIGTVLDDKFELLELIGEGGMGKVYRALDLGIAREVAIKLLHKRFLGDQQAIKRFRNEGKSISMLAHDHIVEIYLIGSSSEMYIAMELLRGKSLAQIIKEEGPLTAERFKQIALQCCGALEHAHEKGVLHRDLKPANIILIEKDGQEDFVKLADFGIAKILPNSEGSAQKLTQTGEIFGSPIYMSPEQCRSEVVDQRSDIYAFGCVMYEALTGSAPFNGESIFEVMMKQMNEEPKAFRDVISPLARQTSALEPIVQKAMSKQVGDRYQSARQLSDAIETGGMPRSKILRMGNRGKHIVYGITAVCVLALLTIAVRGRDESKSVERTSGEHEAFQRQTCANNGDSSFELGNYQSALDYYSKAAEFIDRSGPYDAAVLSKRVQFLESKLPKFQKDRPALLPALYEHILKLYKDPQKLRAVSRENMDFMRLSDCELAKKLVDASLRVAAWRADQRHPMEAMFSLEVGRGVVENFNEKNQGP